MDRITIGWAAMICSFIVGVAAVSGWFLNPIESSKPAHVTEHSNVAPVTELPEINRFGKDGFDPKTLCDRVSEIKFLDVKGRIGYDEAYDDLIAAGERVIPCLVDKITDETIMPDPRGTRISNETKVGDVAYFVLTRITKLDFAELLPAKIREEYKTKGVYAYHEYIERKGSRKQLRKALSRWYADRNVN